MLIISVLIKLKLLYYSYMKTYLITGGAGFIGSNYLNIFVKKNPNNLYVCLDALTYAGNLTNIKDIIDCKNFKFVKGNICDKELVNKLFELYKFDYVINFAAETHVDNSIKDSDIFYETNVLGTKVLLDACRKYGIKRFHQISTDEVYGNNVLGYKFKEDDKLNPSSPYSASKAAADLLVLSYFKTYNIPVTISRSSNNYGYNQNQEKLIPMIINNALSDKDITIYGDGNNIRDWLFVDDHCDAIELIIINGKEGEIYNISNGFELSNNEVVKKILNILNKPESLIKYVDDRLGHDFRYGIDISKIMNELHWKPKHIFNDEILTSIINHTK